VGTDCLRLNGQALPASTLTPGRRPSHLSRILEMSGSLILRSQVSMPWFRGMIMMRLPSKVSLPHLLFQNQYE
jgi:hypothetical protein